MAKSFDSKLIGVAAGDSLGDQARAENPFFSGISRKKLVGAVPPGKRPARTEINPCYNDMPF